ncbi:3-deoxy-D-manno-octulosonic acid transferase [Thioalkalivibrio sp. AKL19]|uniref:3-deoxy-D-manno-octulosonic acid transferase n=1 Tax=Thioalkalivibrio sp. AKL19 TaxID=1266914 RepID=UPI00040D3122|nr:3-deoxy-D-manno-octulosonic acid transferase [Thioalkalivibrio sp. AKL19]
MTRVVYTALLALLTPLLLIRHGLRSRRASVRVRPGEVMGWAPPPDPAEIWIHAVSVGEVLAAEPLIRQLLAPGPRRILVTTTTPTGASMLTERLGDRVMHRFMPLDLPWLQGRFLRAARPQCIVVMETEIWPNMLATARRSGIPVVLANARMSGRSARRYARIPRLIEPALSAFDWIACRNPLDRERFVALGAVPDRVTVNGDIKFDIRIEAADRQEVKSLRPVVDGRPVVILASTHADEEAQLLPGLRALRAEYPRLLVIVAPRHPQRFPEVADLLERSGQTFVRRSDGVPDANTHFWLLDTLGELKRFFGLADVAFIGGSLVSVGGHNPLEATLWKCPVVMGPHVDNFELLVERMESANVLWRSKNIEEAVARMGTLLGEDEARREILRQRATVFIGEQQGATARLLEYVNRHAARDDGDRARRA